MNQPSTRLFRAKALERLSSPEQLDQAMRVISLRDWIPLATLGGLLLLAVAWSVLGRLPVNVEGRGAFVDPRVALGAEAQVVEVQALGSGILLSLHVKRGDFVHKGQLLGTIDQPELEKQLQLERERLAELVSEQQSLARVTARQEALDRDLLRSQRQGLVAGLQHTRELAPLLQVDSLAVIREQRRALELRRTEARTLVSALRGELAEREGLRKKGLITEAIFLEVQTAYFSALDQLADLESEARELDVKELEVRKASVANASQLSDFQTRLRDLEVRANTEGLERLQSEIARSSRIREAERRIGQLEAERRKTSEVRSETDGRVLELTGNIGEMVQRGNRLASIKRVGAPGSRPDLTAVAYFTIADGTRLRPGMRVQITPDTVKREEYGGIDGRVYAVSEYPVTVEGVTNIVNNPSLAEDLYGGKRTMEVFIRLLPDARTASGYRWTSSRGPHIRVSVGTTSSVRITVEEKPPITFLLPVLRPFFPERGA